MKELSCSIDNYCAVSEAKEDAIYIKKLFSSRLTRVYRNRDKSAMRYESGNDGVGNNDI